MVMIRCCFFCKKDAHLMSNTSFQSLKKTSIEGMLYSGGWGGRPAWAIWMASGGALLWKSGGILLPMGVLMTKPIVIESFGNNSGLLVAKNKRFSPIALGTPPRHPIVDQILKAVVGLLSRFSLYNDKLTYNLT